MKFLVRFFQPPIFEDEDKTLRAQLLNILILSVFVAVPLILLGNVLSPHPQAYIYWTAAIGIGSALGLRWLMHRGQVYLASLLWVSLTLGIVTIGIMALETVRATNTFVFLINIAVAGFLLNRRAVVGVTVYSCIAVLLLGWAQNVGWLPTEEEMSISIALNLLALFTGMAMLISVSVRMMNQMIGTARNEVAERRKTERTLRQRDAIMQAATFAAGKFLQSSDWREEINEVLAQLGKATASSHVFLFENHILEDGAEVTSQRYEWVAPGMKPDLKNPLYQNMRLNAPPIKEWYEAMMAGEAYYGTPDILSPYEIEIYAQEGLLSFINVPIFVGEQWWGLIGFDDYVTPRTWTPIEIDAVKITASTLGAAIYQQFNAEGLRRRDAILQAVNFAAQRFLQAEDWRKEISAVLAQFGHATQASHAYIFEKHLLPNGLPALSQKYEWVAEGVTPDMGDPEFENIEIFNRHADPWFDRLASGEMHQGNLESLQPAEREFFRSRKVKAIIDAPIMVGGQWWGVIGFDDCFTLRTWSLAEMDAIKIAASTLGTAIQRKTTDETLHRRDAILQAATTSARSFLQSSDWRGEMPKVLEQLGQATTSSHVFIFENMMTSDGEWVTSLRFEWSAPGIQSDMDNPLYQNVPIISEDEWYLTMAAGKVYYANLDTLPPSEAEIFRQQGLLSLINIPIFVGNEWWGNIGLDDFLEMRQWSSVEIDALQIAASTLGAAIQRQINDEALRRADAILHAVNYAAQQFFQSEDWRQHMVAVLEQLGRATQSSHAYIFEKHTLPNGIPVISQRYEWVAEGCQPDIDDPEFQNIEIFHHNDDPWYEALARGEVRYGNLATLPSGEIEFFRQRGVKALVDAPIMIADQWWGVIGFDDCFVMRQWATAEIDAIKIAASTLSAAIQRQSSDEALRQSEARYRTELEQRVQDRTHQLADALREIEGVSYTASHDLRAPVRAINGYANILLREFADDLNDVQRDGLLKIDRESRRMGNLLDDLIRLIQLNRQALRITKVNLRELARKTVEDLQQRYPDRMVEVTIFGPLIVSGDRAMLQTVIDELLDNAWKFMGTQTTPHVEIGEIPHEGQRTFFVRDNGIGIEMAYAHKLFRNFEQLHQPGLYEGTGMGLAIVQRVVQRHAGKVWVQGAAGEGMTVFFSLGEMDGN